MPSPHRGAGDYKSVNCQRKPQSCYEKSCLSSLGPTFISPLGTLNLYLEIKLLLIATRG